MKDYICFGYDRNKTVGKWRLPLETIASERINPWLVDLFDDDYVELDIAGDGQPMFFNRFKELSFCYPTNHKDIDYILCSLESDGSFWAVSVKTEFVPVAETETARVMQRVFEKILPVSGSFSTHFQTFLEMVEKGQVVLGNVTTVPFTIRDIPLRFELRGSNLVLEQLSYSEIFAHEITGGGFTGKTIEKIEVSKQMPEYLAWVFDAFAGLNPTIFGGSIRDLLRDKEPADIDFFVDAKTAREFHFLLQSLSQVKKVYELTKNDGRYGHSLENPVFEFERDGRKYHMVSRGNFLSDNFWFAADFSLNQCYASAKDVIVASRICLFSRAYNCFFLVSRMRHKDIVQRDLVAKWQKRAKSLFERGFVCEPNMFEDHDNEVLPEYYAYMDSLRPEVSYDSEDEWEDFDENLDYV